MPDTLLAIVLALAPAVLATALPLPLWVARWRGRNAGITIERSRALHLAHRVDTMLLDRWGTVTTGELRVSSVDPIDPAHDRNLRWFAGALEHAATDPVGRAIARLAGRGRLGGVHHERGQGIRGSVDRHPVRVGQPSWMGMESRHDIGVTVGVEVDHRPLGYITVTDDVRPNAAESIARLRRDGHDPVLVSDDTARNTEHLADECGFEEWHAEATPEKREQLVSERQERGRVVAVAGSPERNAAAFDVADLTLTDAPDSPADIRLADLDADRVGRALSLARSVRTATGRTRWIGIAIAALGVVLAALGVLAPLLAAGFAVFGCLVVCALSLGARA